MECSAEYESEVGGGGVPRSERCNLVLTTHGHRLPAPTASYLVCQLSLHPHVNYLHDGLGAYHTTHPSYLPARWLGRQPHHIPFLPTCTMAWAPTTPHLPLTYLHDGLGIRPAEVAWQVPDD